MSEQASPSPSNDKVRLERARRRVAALKGFYVHLSIFALVIALLVAVNLVTGGPWWVLWVFLGWGIGVIAHAVGVMGRAPAAIERWEARKVQKYMSDK